jgi:hypothetical protein
MDVSIPQPHKQLPYRIFAEMHERIVVFIVSRPATYCNVNGSVYSRLG